MGAAPRRGDSLGSGQTSVHDIDPNVGCRSAAGAAGACATLSLNPNLRPRILTRYPGTPAGERKPASERAQTLIASRHVTLLGAAGAGVSGGSRDRRAEGAGRRRHLAGDSDDVAAAALQRAGKLCVAAC